MSLILDGTNGVSDIDGTAATPAIRGTDTNTGIFFPAADTIAFAEGGVEQMRLNSAGNLSLGTTSSTWTNGRAIEGSGAGYGLWMSSPNSANYVIGNYYNDGADKFGGTGWALRYQQNTFFGTHTWESSTASGTAGGAVTIVERMRIASSGEVLVGTTANPNGVLLRLNATSGVNSGRAIQTVTDTTGTVNAVFFSNPNGNVGNIAVNSNSVNYNSTSDYRLKENITPMTGALGIVQQLKPVTYNWKVDGSSGQGFIAHELQAVVPDAVTGEKDAVDAEGNPEYQGIDTSFLVATLTAAIQELKATVDAQAARIAALEAE